MQQGWIKTHRSIIDNVLWSDKPYAKGQAWIDLILRANHSDSQILIGNKTITIERGQLFTSVEHLAERWGWSRNKVNAFFGLLKRLSMATTQGTSKGTLITIENYAFYQSLEFEKVQHKEHQKVYQKDIKRTSKGHQKDIKRCTNKNVKNDKNVKNEKNEKNIYSDLPEGLHEPIENFIEMRKKVKKPLTDKALELILKKLFKLSGDDIGLAIDILNQSTMNSWLSVYELKDKKENANGTQRNTTDENELTGIIRL